MEYSFRNSANGKPQMLVLGDYGFTLHNETTEEAIPYANIVAVRISRSIGKSFRVHLYPDDRRPVVIPSQSFSENGKTVDQSREYSMLVRVLHHHLKDKSKASFSCGGNSDKIWQWVGISAIISFVLSIIAEYLGVGLINPYVQALILAVLSAIIVIVFNARNLPKTYEPTEIPLQFLP